MKIALYIEDDLEQIVLTPESDTEKAILGKIHDGSRSLSIHRGSFYNCNGGWARYTPHWESLAYGGAKSDDTSTMIVLRPIPKTAEKGPENPEIADQPQGE